VWLRLRDQECLVTDYSNNIADIERLLLGVYCSEGRANIALQRLSRILDLDPRQLG
jgi:hypothetical protein